MPDCDKLFDMLVQMTGHISSIDMKLSSFCEKLVDHEHRIMSLEQSKPARNEALLHKALVIALIVIAALTGAGKFLSLI